MRLRTVAKAPPTVQLYLGDCLEVMGHIPEKSVDMILCDLPYGKTNNIEDKLIPFEELWSHYNRIIKDNGAIVLFSQGTFYVDLVNSNRKMFRYDFVWDKELTSGFLNANRMPLRQHEQIAVFYKKLPTYNPQFSVGEPLHSKGKSYKSKPVKNQNYGHFEVVDDIRQGSTEKYPTSILRFMKPHPSVSLHRTEKPVSLLEYLIRTYTDENEVVLDNCMGSGSTGVACINTNRRFVGIELSEKYYNVAKGRIEQCQKDLAKTK